MTDLSKNYTNQPIGVIKRLIDNSLMDLHVSLPAKVVKYDYATQKADVQPLIKKRYRDGTVKSFPTITSVPVCFPRVNNSYVYMPLKKGDKVLVIISDYSLDNYLFGGQEIDPMDLRSHHLSDAFCVLGGYDFHNPIADLANADDLVIKNNVMKITMKPTGKCSIVGTDGVDLVTEAYNLASEGENATVSVVTTPITGTPWSTRHNASLNNSAAFGAIKTKLAKIKI